MTGYQRRYARKLFIFIALNSLRDDIKSCVNNDNLFRLSFRFVVGSQGSSAEKYSSKKPGRRKSKLTLST